MSLADDLAKEPVPVGQRCTVGILRAGFNKQDRQAFDDAIAKIKAVPADIRRGNTCQYTSSWLLNILRANGYTLSKGSLRKHLNQECTCEETLKSEVRV